MKTSQDGFQQCYNAQIVVDGDTQLIVTAAVSAQASDQGQLPRLLDAVQAHYDHTPTRLLADAGYRNEGDLQELETRGIDGYVALGREGHTASGRCPHGAATRRMQTKLDTAQGQQVCPAQVAGGSAHRLDQAHPGLSPIRDARLAPCPGRVGSGLSGPERQAPAPPAAELSRVVPDSPRAPGRTATVHPHVMHALWFCAVRVPPSLGSPPVSALKALPAPFLRRGLLGEAFPELALSLRTYYCAEFLIDKDCIFGNIH